VPSPPATPPPRRNRLMKRQEQAEFEAARQKAVQADEKQDGKV